MKPEWENDPELDEAAKAALRALPETFEMPPEVEELWKSYTLDEEFVMTKGALMALQTAVARVSKAQLAIPGLIMAMVDHDEQRGMKAFGQVSAELVEAENAVSRMITHLVARKKLAELRAENANG